MEETIVRSIGHFGRYQLWIVLLIYLNRFPVAWHSTIATFIAPNSVEFECKASDGIDKNETCSSNCTEYKYDLSKYGETIVTKWDLVCDKQLYSGIARLIFMFGILIGNILFGILSDKFGRRPPFVFSAILQLFSGIGTALSPSFSLFIVMRFITGIATGGSMLISFVILMELVGPNVREPVSILFHLPYGFGHCTLPLLAYLIHDWKILQLAVSSVSVIYISYYWLIPESPTWLFTTGQLDKAAAVLEKAARFNKLPDNTIRNDLEEAKKRRDATNPGSITECPVIDLFRYPNLRLKTLVMSFSWLVCGLTSSGLSSYFRGLTSNVFTNVAIIGALYIVGTIITLPMIKYLGRKVTLITSNIIAGLCMISIACVPQKQDTIKAILASFCLIGIIISFSNIYLYWAELLPTVLRNTGMGFGGMAARLGAMITPYIFLGLGERYWVPPVIFGAMLFIGAGLAYLLPETRGLPLSDTVEDSENVGKRKD